MIHPIPLGHFMEHCARSYYRGQHAIGRGGDFVTAPELSQVFGEMIALWLYFAYEALGKPQDFNIIEFGPGRGTLFADIVRTAKKWTMFDAGMHGYLIEESSALKAVQHEKLGNRVSWPVDIEDVPVRPTLLIANEFFDALPIEQYRLFEGQSQQLYVNYCDETHQAQPFWEACSPAPEGEQSPAREGYLKKVLTHFEDVPTIGLIIDYGAENLKGLNTLQGIYQGKKASPFAHPGQSDITSHVDFGALRRVVEGAGFKALGPVPQGDFLKTLGIETRTQHLAQKSEKAHDILMATYRLISYTEMGSLFKAFSFNNINQTCFLGFGDDCV